MDFAGTNSITDLIIKLLYEYWSIDGAVICALCAFPHFTPPSPPPSVKNPTYRHIEARLGTTIL